MIKKESEGDRWRKIASDYKCNPDDPKEAGEELTEDQQDWLKKKVSKLPKARNQK